MLYDVPRLGFGIYISGLTSQGAPDITRHPPSLGGGGASGPSLAAPRLAPVGSGPVSVTQNTSA
eukprot:1495731-Rhodomonas_salina.2